MIKYTKLKTSESKAEVPAGFRQLLRGAGIVTLTALLFTACPEPIDKIVGKMPAPESMTAIAITPWEVLFVWAPVKNAAYYELIECDENGETTLNYWLTENQYRVLYLDDRKPTEYRLVARAPHYEDSEPFVLSFQRPDIPGYELDAPQTLSAIAPESDPRAATLEWEPVPGATRYEIYRSGAAAGDARFYRIDTPEPVAGPAWTDTGLPNNTQLYYCVRAFNDELECGPVSEIASVCTGNAPNTTRDSAYPLAKDREEGFCLYYTVKRLWFSAEADSEGTLALSVSGMNAEYPETDDFMTVQFWELSETEADDGSISAEWVKIAERKALISAANGGSLEIAIAGLTQGKNYLVSCENAYYGPRRFKIMLASGGVPL